MFYIYHATPNPNNYHITLSATLEQALTDLYSAHPAIHAHPPEKAWEHNIGAGHPYTESRLLTPQEAAATLAPAVRLWLNEQARIYGKVTVILENYLGVMHRRVNDTDDGLIAMRGNDGQTSVPSAYWGKQVAA